jgi:hypothetical protein
MAESNWRDLCERIRHESDPEVLMTLVEELNRTLARQEWEQQHVVQGETLENLRTS